MPPRGRGGRGRGKKYLRKIPITLPDNDSNVALITEYDANINTQEDIPPQGRPCPPLEPRIENIEIREDPSRAETPIDDEENRRTPIEETPSESEGNTKEQKSKKQKKSCRLRDDQEEVEVLEWVEEHPILWNKKHKEYKNKSMKDRIWQDKADEIDIDGNGSKDLTDREKWVMDRFKFLKTNIRHRRAPVKSVQEALAVARGDLDEAERIAAEDRLAIISADESIEEGQNTDADVPIPKTKKQKKAIDDPILEEVRKQFTEAQEDLRSVKSALSVAEPVTERTTFLDWVREVCKNVSDDQFCEFQTSFIQLQNRWKQQRKQQTSPVITSNSFTASGPSGIRSSCFFNPCQVCGECRHRTSKKCRHGRASRLNSCDSTSQVQNSGPCPVPTVPTVNTSMTYVAPQPGATLNLDCWYDSPVVVSGVKWAFTDKNNINREINETTKPSKYSGSTYSTPSLTVNSFSQSDEGLYKCIVENFMGAGMSNVINASLAPCKISFGIKFLP
ncbi:unnamed protein product [Mytilus coruscus]|uniref:Ig-like domain-containing protein n=1 Tax=Mytilus coruscus TaxID=42192 RepID=A0A6J8ARA1_MYTCO|nr:unnamed protein product [Mytilus coruscus]